MTDPNCCTPTTLTIRLEMVATVDKRALEREYGEHYTETDVREMLRETALEAVRAQFPLSDESIVTKLARRL